MEQIETQATDLRYLTQMPALPLTVTSPAGRAGDASMSPRQLSSGPRQASGSAPPGDNSALFSPDPSTTSSSTKRRPDQDDAGPKQQRSKRNRYISIACNECKRRKIKCNGETPCARCGNLNLACLYSPNCCSNNFRDSDEYKQMTDKVHHLEEQVETLFQNVNVLRQDTQRLAPLQERLLPMPSTLSPSPSASIPSLHKPELAPIRSQHAYRGPTSIAFTVGVAKNTLHNMGYSGEPPDEPGGPSIEDTPRGSPVLRPVTASSQPAPQRPADPLWEFDKDEMVRLCRVHEDEVGIMYPVVKIETVINHVQYLNSWMDSSRRAGYAIPPDYDRTMADIHTLLVKIIMCSALTVEEHGHSERAIALYASLQPVVDRKLMSEPSDIANLPFLALVAGYRFLSSDEVLAWRVMGQVARHCLEQGLHRREGIAKIADEHLRRDAITTFWTAYVLDRRWSFGTGLPYVVDDAKIDPNLPFPEDYPYLVAMITYSRLGAKIWRLVDFFEPAIIRDLRREEFEELDREILQWYDSVPPDVKLNRFDREPPMPSTPSYNLQRLQIWTRLRLNQIRIWLHTPILHSASSINANMALAQEAVDLAKDTIHYLTRLNNSTNLYRRIQVFYHQFLTSAIAVLFLASAHQPVQFSANCRHEFYMALTLIKDMSAKSWVSQRLWRTVRSLKAYAPRLGLQQSEDAQYATAPASSFGANTPYMAHGTPSTASPSSMTPTGRSSSSVNWPPPQLPPPQLPPPQLPPPPPPFPSAANPHDAQQTTGPPPTCYSHAAPTLPALNGSHESQTPSAPEPSNGTQLHAEMSRIFEGYMGMSGIPLPPAGTVDDKWFVVGDSAGLQQRPGSGLTTPQSEAVYEQVKSMF